MQVLIGVAMPVLQSAGQGVDGHGDAVLVVVGGGHRVIEAQPGQAQPAKKGACSVVDAYGPFVGAHLYFQLHITMFDDGYAGIEPDPYGDYIAGNIVSVAAGIGSDGSNNGARGVGGGGLPGPVGQ